MKREARDEPMSDRDRPQDVAPCGEAGKIPASSDTVGNGDDTGVAATSCRSADHDHPYKSQPGRECPERLVAQDGTSDKQPADAEHLVAEHLDAGHVNAGHVNDWPANDWPASEWIERYVDGELSSEEIEALEARLRDDPAFRRELSITRRVDALIVESLTAESVTAESVTAESVTVETPIVEAGITNARAANTHTANARITNAQIAHTQNVTVRNVTVPSAHKPIADVSSADSRSRPMRFVLGSRPIPYSGRRWAGHLTRAAILIPGVLLLSSWLLSSRTPEGKRPGNVSNGGRVVSEHGTEDRFDGGKPSGFRVILACAMPEPSEEAKLIEASRSEGVTDSLENSSTNGEQGGVSRAAAGSVEDVVEEVVEEVVEGVVGREKPSHVGDTLQANGNEAGRTRRLVSAIRMPPRSAPAAQALLDGFSPEDQISVCREWSAMAGMRPVAFSRLARLSKDETNAVAVRVAVSSMASRPELRSWIRGLASEIADR